MVQTLVIVNGEAFWEEHFVDDFDVHHVRLQTSKWIFKDDVLFVYDAGKRIRVDNIFWRIGAVRPIPYHREVLELIQYANVPCINAPSVMLDSLNRWTMLNRLKALGLPIMPSTLVVNPLLANEVKPKLPCVVKIGSYHAGYGKMRITSLEQWQDMVDFVFATDGYFTVEPYIEYIRDVRCLAVGNQIWTLARKGSRWKANTGIVETQLITAPDILYDYTKRVVEAIGADVLALDILETVDNDYIVLESNSVPGLAGFPQIVIDTIVDRAKSKFDSTQ